MVKKTLRRGGKVIIPAVAVGRTQELVFFLNQMWKQTAFLACRCLWTARWRKTTEISRISGCHDKETHEFVRREKTATAGFQGSAVRGIVEESKKINNLQGPAV